MYGFTKPDASSFLKTSIVKRWARFCTSVSGTIPRSLGVTLVLLSGMGARVSAQQLDPDVLAARIEAGDYETHVGLFDQDADLLGFAAGFTEAYERYCPKYRMKADELVFTTGLAWELLRDRSARSPRGQAVSLDEALESLIIRPVPDLLQHNAGWQLGNQWVTSLTDRQCGPQGESHRLATNAARLIAGHRPLFRNTDTSKLKKEEIALIEIGHMYKDGRRALFHPGSESVLKEHYRHAASIGATVLTCHYDLDPQEPYYVLQYHWGPSAAQYLNATAGFLSWVALPAMQRQYNDATSEPMGAIHPFLRFGPARPECPASPDPDLPTDQLGKPRSEIVSAPMREGEKIEPKDVRIRRGEESPDQTWYEYGLVPDDFVPPIPPEHQAGIRYSIEMEKNGPYKLMWVSFGLPASITLGYTLDELTKRPFIPKVEDSNRAAVEGYKYLDCGYTGDHVGQAFYLRSGIQVGQSGLVIGVI